MSQGFKSLQPPSAGRGRIRLSGGTIQSLEWAQQGQSFECYGFFRNREELLCAPADWRTDTGEHPFSELLRVVDAVRNPEPITSLRDIPSIRALLAEQRLVTFSASWTNEARTQLDLNLGVEVTDRLGWARNPTDARPIYIGSFAHVFIAMSERRYLAALEEDFAS